MNLILIRYIAEKMLDLYNVHRMVDSLRALHYICWNQYAAQQMLDPVRVHCTTYAETSTLHNRCSIQYNT